LGHSSRLAVSIFSRDRRSAHLVRAAGADPLKLLAENVLNS
jgi:hypothetical protein